jgi:ribosomal protein S27AE
MSEAEFALLGPANLKHMPRKEKIHLEKVQAALNTLCPKCGYSIPPAEIRRVDFDRMECPKCGEHFAVK